MTQTPSSIPTRKQYKYLFLIFLILFTAFAFYDVFNDLSMAGEIIEWDEARHGVNAFEMLQNGNYMVNTFQHQPDYWNVKPPLSMWQIMLGYKIFGYNTFALRFFSALYLPLTVVISMPVLYKYKGFFCAVTTGFLFSVSGSRFYHLFKTGDPDALFFFLCFLSCVFFYMAFKDKPKLLMGAGLCVALAFLAKGMHVISLFAVTAAVLALNLKRKKFSVKQLLLFLLLPTAAPVLIWAVLRAGYDGLEFFKKMFMLDVFNRVTTVVENHAGDTFYYFKALRALLGNGLLIGLLLLVLLFAFNRLTSKEKIETDAAFITVFIAMALFPLWIFTMAATKISWYVYPSVIGLYFCAGYLAQQIANGFKKKKQQGEMFVLVACLAVIAVGGFVKPIKGHINNIVTDVSPNGDVFSLMQEAPPGPFVVVNPQGQADVLHSSWLLRAYFLGYQYIPGGIEQAANGENAFVVVKHKDDAELENLRTAYPYIAAGVEDYVNGKYSVLTKSARP